MRKMIFSAIVVLLLSVTGQASASISFADGDLIRVVYSGTGTGTEYATDLGNFANLTNPSASKVVLNTNNIDFTRFGGATMDQIYVAYYMVTSVSGGFAGNYAWSSGPAGGQTGGGRNKFSDFEGGVHYVSGAYQLVGGGAPNVTLLQSDPASYWTIMNYAGSGQGQMRGFIPAANADQNLAALSTAGYVDQYLYFYATPNSTKAGAPVSQIKTFADGHTELTPISANPCAAVLSDDLSLHIPILTFGGLAFSADFSYVPNTLDFTLTNADVVTDTTPYGSCAPATLSNDLKFHIPVVMFQNMSYWLDLTYKEGVTVTFAGADANQATLTLRCCQHGVKISKEEQ